MTDRVEIKTESVDVKEWRITGTDSALRFTVTAWKGEHVTIADHNHAGMITATAALAGELAAAVEEAAIFVTGGAWADE